MGFFKGFKRDFAQAVNELMPEYDTGDSGNPEEEKSEAEEAETETAASAEQETPAQEAPQEDVPEAEDTIPDLSGEAAQEYVPASPAPNLDEAVTEAMLREEILPADYYDNGEETEEEEFGVIPTYEMEGQFSMFEGETSAEGEAADGDTPAQSVNAYAAENGMPENVPEETVNMPAMEEEEEEEEEFEEEEVSGGENREENTAAAEAEEREDQELSELGTEIRKEDSDFDLGDTTYITKNTTINGDMETEGSLDVIGTVNGNVTCLGKLILGGRINGNLSVGDLYANQAHIHGEIEATGHVKIGAGTISVGNIKADSAVIAGAVKGDLDVQGQVVVDSTAVILGNIKSKSVQVNSGAIVDGFCTQVYADVNPEAIFADDPGQDSAKDEAEVIEPISEEEMKETGRQGGQNRSNNNRNRKNNGGQKKNG